MTSEIFLFYLLFFLLLPSCANENKSQSELQKANQAQNQTNAQQTQLLPQNKIKYYDIKVLNAYPHDPKAFTQGLAYCNGFLYESTGLYGSSTLRKVELKTGKVLKEFKLDNTVFAEGITILNDKIYQLSWVNHTCYVYDITTFHPEKKFGYYGEGWGIATDGAQLIMSDGTNTLRFIKPETFDIIRTLQVSENGSPLDQINELEYIDGYIWANIWQTKKIAVINPSNGFITGWIDLSSLYDYLQYNDFPDVLNGIVYDPQGKRIFVTGKLWQYLFEIKLVEKN
jgi:glutamine cyclotransferase